MVISRKTLGTIIPPLRIEMANNVEIADAAMASPRPRRAALARAPLPLPIAGAGVPVSSSPAAVKDPESIRRSMENWH